MRCAWALRTSQRQASIDPVANTREIARRIQSIRNLGQVTRAYQMISASRMRKAQERALAARPYAQKTGELLRHLAQASTSEALHPLLTVRPVRRLAVVLIASDRGLCGGYNSSVIRRGLDYARRAQVPVAYVTVGRKAQEAVLGIRGELLAEFEALPAELTISYASPVARLIEDAFLGGDVDAAAVAYTQFVSIGVQAPSVRQVLPVAPGATEAAPSGNGASTGQGVARLEYLYEPSAADILDSLLPHSLEVEILGCLLESAASEHSARMVAMQMATDNAGEMVEELTRTYNRARQASITGEILDIVGATEALRVG